MKFSLSCSYSKNLVLLPINIVCSHLQIILFSTLFLCFSNQSFAQLGTPVMRQKFDQDILRIIDKIEKLREQKKLNDEEVAELLRETSIPLDEDGRMIFRIRAASLEVEQELRMMRISFSHIGTLEYEVKIFYRQILTHLMRSREIVRVWCPEPDEEIQK
ncbi:MAG: hypothetical protein HYV28_14090 [Ignavibacteriales bacterium]|nr:hypothetical protein [Ignavibacteriales bacterium]